MAFIATTIREEGGKIINYFSFSDYHRWSALDGQ